MPELREDSALRAAAASATKLMRQFSETRSLPASFPQITVVGT